MLLLKYEKCELLGETMTYYNVTMKLNEKVPMRDGVNLSADVYIPQATGTFPTVLMRTPYDNNVDRLIDKAISLVNQGYVCVLQDVRGRHDSDGDYYPFINEAEDGYDTQEWIGNQTWSNGKIGMSGSSYGGWVQWQSALKGSKYLTCIAPQVMCGDLYSGLVYPGGAMFLNVVMTWGMRTNGRTGQSIEYHNWTEAFRSLPLTKMDELAGRNLPFWKDWLNNSSYNEYWSKTNHEDRFSDISVPALNMSGWFDLYSETAFTNFNGLISNGSTDDTKKSQLIVGPWPHQLSASTKVGDVDFGAESMLDLNALELKWFDYWMKGINNGIIDESPIKLFIMGVNEWRNETEWPLARTKWEKWYLHSGGNANTVEGDGTLSTDPQIDEASDEFDYNPEFPVQTIGGNNCCSPNIVPWGPYDQRPVEMRPDVLCYTSDVLETDVEITGPIKLILYASTDGLDTDWTAKLIDVSETGYAMNLCDGIIRARFREGFEEPLLLAPNEIYRYEINVGVTGNVFMKGHKIRLEVSSSNFPRYDRNPNTGREISTETELRTAHQTIAHNKGYPSHIVLPIIPRS